MTDLNELFEQILHSEKKFKARIDELRLTGKEIEQRQSHIQEVRDKSRTKQGELAVKRNKLADIEVDTKILKVRNEILRKRKNYLQIEKEEITVKVVEAEVKYRSERAAFLEELNTFSKYHDLFGCGCKHRDDELRRKKSVLQDELLLLETEFVEIKCQLEEKNKLEAALMVTGNKLTSANRELAELTQTVESLKSETDALEQEKNMMDQTVCQEPEFLRLQKELDSCKAFTGELVCKQLSKELEELQRQCYHKQMRHQLASKKRGSQQSSTASSRNTGHYNPYTLTYVPAPNTEQQPISSSTVDTAPTDVVTVTDDSEEAFDYEDDGGDSIAEWGMDLDDDYFDYHENSTSDVPVLHSETKKHLPPSNFQATTKPTSLNTSSNDFKQASSITNHPNVTPNHNSTLNKNLRKRASSGSSRDRLQSTVSIDSPEPQLARKRQGESIFKSAGPQESSIPKRPKKVRFHY